MKLCFSHWFHLDCKEVIIQGVLIFSSLSPVVDTAVNDIGLEKSLGMIFYTTGSEEDKFALKELFIPFPSRSTAHKYSKYISYFKCEFKITGKGNLSQVNWTIIHWTLFYGVVYVFGDLRVCVIDMNFDFFPSHF